MENPDKQRQQNDLPKDLADLAAAVAGMSAEVRTKLEPLLWRVIETTKRRQRIMSLVQEALSQLRLDVKFVLFDLEATRRERNKLLQERDEDGLESDE